MSRVWPIIKREFSQAVNSKSFIIGTILGPVLMVAIFAAQFFIIARSGGGEHTIIILDATGRDMAPRVAQAIEERAAATPSFMARPTFDFEVQQVADADRAALREEIDRRIRDKELDGFLWLPSGTVEGRGIRYEGSNATNSAVMADLRQGVQRVVQSERLRDENIDEARLGHALQTVPVEISRSGAGNVAAAKILAFGMAFAIYIMVIMWGQSIMMSVQEEKRDRIVELIVSSVRARDVLFGKVIGIGGAGLLQLSAWVLTAVLVLTYGTVAAAAAGIGGEALQAFLDADVMPQLPVTLGIVFLLFFAGGFLLSATMFAVIGALVTNTQEAQQFVFPVLLPLMLGFFIAIPAADNPNSTIAVVGSIIPLTSAMVMPVRASVAGIEWGQVLLALGLLFATAAAIVWLAAKIYRVAIFATGKKPTASEIVRWMRAA